MVLFYVNILGGESTSVSHWEWDSGIVARGFVVYVLVLIFFSSRVHHGVHTMTYDRCNCLFSRECIVNAYGTAQDTVPSGMSITVVFCGRVPKLLITAETAATLLNYVDTAVV